MLKFAALEARINRQVVSAVANVRFAWWQGGLVGGTESVPLLGVFDRVAVDSLGGSVQGFDPVLTTSADNVPGIGRGDGIVIDNAIASWFMYYFGQNTPRYQVVQARPDGTGLVTLDLRAQEPVA